MKKMSINQYIYSITQKPQHYVEVRNPPRTAKEKLARPQAARQLQYNRWSKRYGVYSGSFLPQDKSRLLKKGWEDKTAEVAKNNKASNPSTFYRRKSTNQWVRNDVTHWHWYHWWNSKWDAKKVKKQENLYYDKYGKLCREKSKESHIKWRE